MHLILPRPFSPRQCYHSGVGHHPLSGMLQLLHTWNSSRSLFSTEQPGCSFKSISQLCEPSAQCRPLAPLSLGVKAESFKILPLPLSLTLSICPASPDSRHMCLFFNMLGPASEPLHLLLSESSLFWLIHLSCPQAE